MCANVYTSRGWVRHRQEGQRKYEFPLPASLTDFLLHRTVRGPSSSFAPLALNSLDTGDPLSGDPAQNGTVDNATALIPGICYTITTVGTTDFILVGATANTVGLKFWCTGVGAGTGTATRVPAYMVEQSPLEWLDGDEMRYVRTFACIPDSWTDPESFVFLFPAFISGALGASKTVTAIAWSTPNHVFTTSAAHGFVAGNVVFLNVKFTIAPHVYQVSVAALVLAAPTATTFTCFGVLPVTGPTVFTAVSGTAALTTMGRLAARNLVGAAKKVYDYALSSDATIDADLPLSQKFTGIDSTGNETSVLSVASFPTAADYGALVAAGSLITAEQSTRRRWRGNIYERLTRLIPAQ